MSAVSNQTSSDTLIGYTVKCAFCDRQFVSLTIQSFDTEQCCDRLILYNGIMSSSASRIATLSGYVSTPAVYVTNQRYMFVTFTSDGSVSGDGFRATFSSFSPTTTVGRGNRTPVWSKYNVDCFSE